MELLELIKTYGQNKGQSAMWGTIEVMQKYLSNLSEEQKECLLKDIYGYLSDGHFDECFADKQCEKMYYVKGNEKHYGPFILKDKVSKEYNNIRNNIKNYNQWDFYVTVQMIYSDNYTLLRSWFPNISDEELCEKVFQMAVNWLDDEDNPFGNKKIWCYFNNKK